MAFELPMLFALHLADLGMSKETLDIIMICITKLT